MLLSMTGFGSGTIIVTTAAGRLSLIVEMKTINSRFFETTCKLPISLNFLEVKLINLLQSVLLRGRVYVFARFAEDSEIFENVTPSLKVIEQYLKAAHTVKEKFKLLGDLTVKDVLTLPNVFELGKSEFTEQEETQILAGFEKIARQLAQMRAAEGARLLKDFEGRFFTCGQRMQEISVHFERVMQEQKTLVDKHLVLSQAGDEQAKNKLEELYATLNKMDIQEEITRFNSHLASVKTLLGDTKQLDKGKRFDFILQELLREVNTLMAKCSYFNISSLSVDVKVELEKAREQVQNIV